MFAKLTRMWFWRRLMVLVLAMALAVPLLAKDSVITPSPANAASAGVNASGCSYINGYCLVQWCVTNAYGYFPATIEVYGYRPGIGYTYRSYSVNFTAGACDSSHYGEKSWYVGSTERMDTITITISNPSYASPTGIGVYVQW